MSEAAPSDPRDARDAPVVPGAHDERPRRDPRSALVFDDPLSRPSADDTDRGWGERPTGDSAADLARFLDEKPPHHI